MRKLFVIAALTLALPIIAQAQDSPRTEIFGGYSYLRLDEDLNNDRDLNGWNASVTQNLIKWLGVTADFSGHYGSTSVFVVTGGDLSAYSFLFGPQFTLRKFGKFQPFGHVLLGVTRANLNSDVSGLSFSDTAFSLAAGGGLDIKVHDRLAVRLFQADYVLTRFNDENQSNFRASTGLVLRLGKKD